MPPPVLVFHPGKQHSPQTALALQQNGRLWKYATSIFYDPDRFPYWLERLPGPLGRRLHAEFTRFEHPEIDPRRVATWGVTEWLERAALRAGMPRLSTRLDLIGNRRFSRGLASDIASDQPFALWGYNGSCAEAFHQARKRGRFCILDRTIGDFRYFRQVMAEQAAAYPQFFSPDDSLVEPGQSDRDDEEYALADRIVVGSDFCRETLIAHSPVPGLAEKTFVLPYCCNNHDFAPTGKPYSVPADEPLRFLFVGRITPRKGIHLLLEAISRFAPQEATLTLVGKMLLPPAAFAPYAERVRYVPSVAPAAVEGIMRDHHVLVLPSFFEGSAITLIEALSSGLGIIQSAQAGNGATADTGIVLPENTAEHLYAAMRQAVDNRDLIDTWRANTREAAKAFAFSQYRDTLAQLLGEWGLG